MTQFAMKPMVRKRYGSNFKFTDMISPKNNLIEKRCF